jgi:hypothetical protein
MKAKRDVVVTRNTLLHFGIVREDEKDLLLLLCQDADLVEYIDLVYAEQAGEDKARRGRAILAQDEVSFVLDYVESVRFVFYNSSSKGSDLSKARSWTLQFIEEFGIASYALCTTIEKEFAASSWLAYKAGEGSASAAQVPQDYVSNFVRCVNIATGKLRLFPRLWWNRHAELHSKEADAVLAGTVATSVSKRTLH